jgi:hypothetical protein
LGLPTPHKPVYVHECFSVSVAGHFQELAEAAGRPGASPRTVLQNQTPTHGLNPMAFSGSKHCPQLEQLMLSAGLCRYRLPTTKSLKLQGKA